MTAYSPIECHGIVGNLETCALISDTGAVDWCCVPHLESQSIFSSLIDDNGGGHFAISPTEEFESIQRYRDRTNVLETTFTTDSGEVTVTDFMPVHEDTQTPVSVQALYRRVTGDFGLVSLDVSFEPRFNYARAETVVESISGGIVARTDHAVQADGTTDSKRNREIVVLASEVPFTADDDTGEASMTVEADETYWFVFDWSTPRNSEVQLDPEAIGSALSRTVDYWRDWAHSCNRDVCVLDGPWHDLVVRSTLVLKLLIHYRVGSVCAAPTTSLPEALGGVRNWDYRYNWIRDGAFTVLALLHVGHKREALEHVEWFLDVCRSDGPDEMQPLYSLHGETDLTERELDNLAGYRDSAPVRIGNAATEQDQHDIFAGFILVIYKAFEGTDGPTRQDWESIRAIVDYVVEIWDEPDSGIWEVRGDERHYVYSKLMDWVALDRGIAMAENGGYTAPLDVWRETRTIIRKDIEDRGWDSDVGAFVQSYEDDALDATALLVPLMGFLPFDDDRVQSTIDVVVDRLTTSKGLVRRHDGNDNLPDEEGSFLFCSFWLVMALALSDRTDEAKAVYEDVLSYVNPLDLLPEEIDADSGVYLGNFPQAFSHIGVIDAAVYLGAVDGGDYVGEEPIGIELKRLPEKRTE